jgi:hypothetical protein
MGRVVMVGVIAATIAPAGCASTPESRLRREVFLDLYWAASRQCEDRYRTLHVTQIGMDGSLSLSADADSRSEFRAFQECYWKGVAERADHRRTRGLAVPEDVNLRPDIELD